MKLSQKMAIFAIIIAVISVGTLSAANYLIPIRSLDQTTEDYAELRADAIAMEINKYMGEQKMALSELINGMVDAEVFADYEKATEHIISADSRHEDSTYYVGFDNGDFLKATGKAFPEYDPRERGWYKEALESEDGVSVSEAYIGATTREMVMTIAQAFKTEDGQTGVIGVDIAVEDLITMIDNLEVGEDSYAFLINHKGNIVTHRHSFIYQ